MKKVPGITGFHCTLLASVKAMRIKTAHVQYDIMFLGRQSCVSRAWAGSQLLSGAMGYRLPSHGPGWEQSWHVQGMQGDVESCRGMWRAALCQALTAWAPCCWPWSSNYRGNAGQTGFLF